MQQVIERILNLLAYLLTVGRPVTAEEIRNTVQGYDQATDDAFRRTFERDKDLLRSLGVPLVMRHTDIWEVELGYLVQGDDYAIADPGFTDEERSALLVAAQAVRFGGQATEAAAIFKLGGASSTFTGALAADLGDDLNLLGDLFGAVSDRHKVLFTYKNQPRTAEPYGLGHRFGHWYLLAPEAGSPGTVKAFRVDRMQQVKVDEAGGAFERPVAFEPRDALPDFSGDSKTDEIVARVRFDPGVADVVARQLGEGALIGRDSGWVTFEVPVTSVSGFIGWILSFDDKAVIESPSSLRNALLSHLGDSDGL